jgi:hypothetical protein
MFSLRALLVGVAIAGLGTAGLIHRTQLWASAFVGITLGLLLFGVCRAWLGSNCTRFWGPFALVGGVYLGIVSLQPLAELHYNLPTTQLVVYGLEKVNAPLPIAGRPRTLTEWMSQRSAEESLGFDSVQTEVIRENLFQLATTQTADDATAAEARAFLWVAQCLWCLLLAAAGNGDDPAITDGRRLAMRFSLKSQLVRVAFIAVSLVALLNVNSEG